MKRDPGEPADPVLIARCLEGDDSAWRSLIDRYRSLIYSVPIRCGLSQEESADVFQDICILLYQKLHLLRDRERLGAWLLTSASRLCWARRRGAKRGQVPFEDEHQNLPSESDALPDEELDALERRRLVWLALEHVPDGCARLLSRLFPREGEASYKEIARELGMPEGSVGPTRQRCLEKLKAVLMRLGFEL